MAEPASAQKVVDPDFGGEFGESSPFKSGRYSRFFEARDEVKDRKRFTEAFQDVVHPSVAEQYAKILVENAVYPDDPIDLTEENYAELGIRIGHRAAIKTVLHEIRRETRGNSDDIWQIADVDEAEKTSPEEPTAIAVKDDECATFSMPVLRHEHSQDYWVDAAGEASSLAAFKSIMKDALHKFAMPSSLQRLFLDNKPLPFLLQQSASRGRRATGILLRIPLFDIILPENEGVGLRSSATTLHRMMNRLVLIYVPRIGQTPGVLITFRKDKNIGWIDTTRTQWTSSVEATLEQLTIQLCRQGMETFRDVLLVLSQQLEICANLPDSYRPKDVVKTISRVQRQAAVVARSLAGNSKVISAVSSDGTFSDEMRGVSSLIDDLHELAEELVNNASEMLGIRLAMIDFKTQLNMKLFTYMSVVVAPLGLITGWFGMNFQDMEELAIPGFYKGVVVFAGCLVICLVCLLVWINRERPVSAEDAAEAEAVLSHSAKHDD